VNNNGKTFQYFIIILLGYFIFTHHYKGVIYIDTIIIAIVIIILLFIRHKTDLKFILERNNLKFYALILWLLIGIFYTNAPNYGMTKLYKFIGFYLLGIFTAKIVTENLNFFLKTMVVFLLIMILDFFYVNRSFNEFISHVSVTSRVEEFGGTSGFKSGIEVSRYIAFTIIIIFISFKERLFNNLWKLISSMLVIFGLIFMALMGSKGPLISMFITFSFLAILYIKNRTKAILYFIAPILLLLFIYFFQDFILSHLTSDLSEYFFYRYFNIEKFTDRPDLFTMALSNINHIIIGEGTGNFGFLWFGTDIDGYPHNIFLELFYENGIIGLLIFLSLLFSTLWRSIHLKIRINRILFTSSILYFLFASMTSGDIIGNPLLFIFLVYSNYCYVITESTMEVHAIKQKT
jgi:hypothetical protein